MNSIPRREAASESSGLSEGRDSVEQPGAVKGRPAAQAVWPFGQTDPIDSQCSS